MNAVTLEGRLPGRLLEVLRRVGRLARQSGAAAALVGGSVRDLLLDRPLLDLDLVIETDVAVLAGKLGLGPVRAHRTFGTAGVRLEDGTRIDLARARVEHYPKPGALPTVRPSPLAEDLARRDFTINAMAVRIDPEYFGRLLDPHGGRRDLAAGLLRVLHTRSFVDDPTRAFRAVEFAARLRFTIEPQTAKQIRAALDERRFTVLSSARLRNEWIRMLDPPHRGAVLRLLRGFGLTRTLHARLVPSARTLAAVDRLRTAHDAAAAGRPWLVALGLLLLDLDPAAARLALDRVRPTREQSNTLARSRREIPRVLASLTRSVRPTPGRVHLHCSGWTDEMLLIARMAARTAGLRRTLWRYAERRTAIRPRVTGHDLLQAGIHPGPAIARGLQAAFRARLDGRAESPEQELRRALRAARRA